MPRVQTPAIAAAALLSALVGVLLAQGTSPPRTTSRATVNPTPVVRQRPATPQPRGGGPCMITAPEDGSVVQARTPIEIGWSRHDQPTSYRVRIYENSGMNFTGLETGILHVSETSTTHSIQIAAIRPNPFRFDVIALTSGVACLDEDDVFGSWIVTPNGSDVATPTPTPAGSGPSPAIRVGESPGNTETVIGTMSLDGSYEEYETLLVHNDGSAPLVIYDIRPVLLYPFISVSPINLEPCETIPPGASKSVEFVAVIDATMLTEARILSASFQMEILSNDPTPPSPTTYLESYQVPIQVYVTFVNALPNFPPPDPTPYGPFPYCAAPSSVGNEAYLRLN